jgi:hypothetical protein
VRPRRAVEALGDLAVAEEGPYPGFDSQRPVGRRDARAFGHPLQCGLDKCRVTGARRRLGQLGHDKRPVPQLIALERFPSRVAGGGVTTEAVVQHRARVGREVDRPAQTACGRFPQGGLDQFRCLRLLAPPGRERRPGIPKRWIPRRLSDHAIFVDHQRCRGQFAGDEVRPSERIQRELQARDRAAVPGDLHQASGQGMCGFGVPQLEGDDGAGSSTCEPEPAVVVCAIRREGQFECSGKRRYGRCISLRQPQRERVEQDIHNLGGSGPGAAARADFAASSTPAGLSRSPAHIAVPSASR